MKCPYCFKINRFRVQKKKGSRIVYYCSICRSEVPKIFIELPEIPHTKIGMIGYSGHGKTIYNLSMLYLLKALPEYWGKFYLETLDDNSHSALNYDVQTLEQGKVFKSTKAVYPRPLFLKLNDLPYFNTQFISLFDTGGRLFENLDLMTSKGRYFSKVDVVFFFISLAEKDMLDNWNMKIMKLLDRYVNVVYSRYGVKTKKKQSIAFIFTKSDKLMDLNGDVNLTDELKSYFSNGTIERYHHIDAEKIEEIKNNSNVIESWLRSSNCNGFINLAKNHFKNISFTMVSAIGSTSAKGALEKKLELQDPKCVLDPLLWAMNVSN
jgi:hypothetical protein